MRAVVEKKFEYKGYNCVITFVPLGWRCGYVGVPKNSPVYGMGMFDCNIECHGGITWSDEHFPIKVDVPEADWWIGFDCNHRLDAPDIEKIERYFPDDAERLVSVVDHRAGSVRSITYCENECKYIVDQLEEMHSAQNK